MDAPKRKRAHLERYKDPKSRGGRIWAPDSLMEDLKLYNFGNFFKVVDYYSIQVDPRFDVDEVFDYIQLMVDVENKSESETKQRTAFDVWMGIGKLLFDK